MASSEAWSQGWSLGQGIARERAAHKQALSDEEFQLAAGRLADELASNRQILSTIDPQKNPQQYAAKVTDLQRNLQDLRELYHPDRHPSAISRFGFLITDKLGLTNPQKRIQRVAANRAANIAGDERAAQGLAAATPAPPPNEVAEYRRKLMEGGFSPADADKAVRIHFGMEPREGQEKYFSQLSTTTDAQGRQHYWRVPMDPRAQPEEVDFNGQQIVPKNAAPIKGTLVRSSQSPTGFAQTWVDRMNPSRIVAWQPITPSRYYMGTRSTALTTDPFGVTTSSTRTTAPASTANVDLSGAMQLSASQDESAPAPGAPQGEQPAVRVDAGAPDGHGQTAAPSLKELRHQAAARAPKAATPQLDAQGHIPAAPGLNEGLRSAANQLLDGMDLEKLPLPARDKQAAAAVAARYGWGQGLFTPQQKLLIREAKTYLSQALNDPALKVLDSPTSRAKLANMLLEHKGVVSSAVAAMVGLSAQEQAFLRMYNQLVGTISGLGQLTRGGRVTEATIARLMRELPNPEQTHSSADAKQRIKRLLSEIDVAVNQGQGIDASGTSAGQGSAAEFLRNFRAGGSNAANQ
ncbi:MAG TPA: hypothetical protein VMU48_15325 [Terracidiphilus sp.]|nr:hypothetical protein [Terracidiphilus sp.]